MGFDLGHTISSLSKFALRTKRKAEKNNKTAMNNFFSEVLLTNSTKYSSLMFNLYEDEKIYSMEAVYDDVIIIRRDNPIEICNKTVDYTAVLNIVKDKLSSFYENNKDDLKNITTLSYGFVDGDLYYIKNENAQPKPKSNEKITFEKIKKFNPAKIGAWMCVYLKKEIKESMEVPFAASFSEMSEDELDKWIHILVENFDYEKYYKNK